MIREYSKYKPFRFWCQKVLPLVYDDSLSYYELLNKVVDYLNNVIKDVNALGTAFEELSAMVTDYFENLDVQEEIDNKLDSMVEDGTLDAMIQPLIGDAVSEWLEDNVTPTGSAVVVDASLTISGAAADAKVTGDEIGNLKSDLNYNHTAEPGYILRATDSGHGNEWAMVGTPTDAQSETAINKWLDEHPEATTTVQDWSLTYRKLVKGTLGFVTPEMFGAKGDGVTDDGDAFRAALNSGYDTIICNGKYVLGGYITDANTGKEFSAIVPDGVTISGTGIIIYPNNNYSKGNTNLGINLLKMNSGIIRDITIDMNGQNNIVPSSGGTWTMYAIMSDVVDGLTIDNVKFKNSAGRDYLFFTGGDDLTVNNCYFKEGGTTLTGNGQDDFSYCYSKATHTRFNGCVIAEPASKPYTYCGGIEIHASNSSVTDCKINHCYPAIYLAETVDNAIISGNIMNECIVGVSLFVDSVVENVLINNNNIILHPIIDSLAATTQNIGVGCGGDVKNMTISNNYIVNTADARPVHDFGVRFRDNATAENVVISNNNVRNCYSAVDFECDGDITVDNNAFLDGTGGSFAIVFPTSGKAIKALVRENISSYDKIINSVTCLSSSQIYCKGGEVRPISAFVESGFFFTEDFFTYNDWAVRLFGTQYEAHRKVSLTADTNSLVTYPIPLSSGSVPVQMSLSLYTDSTSMNEAVPYIFIVRNANTRVKYTGTDSSLEGFFSMIGDFASL